jgi:Tol biopolymer transport system component
LAGVFALNAGPAPAQDITPGQAHVVFSNGGRILTMKADGSDREVLFGKDRRSRNDGLGAIEPDASPDGEKIVFGFRRESGYETLIDVWVMNADGTGARKLLGSTPNRRYGDAEFTADGRIVVARFASNRRHGEARIFTMDADGGSRKVIYRLKQRFRPWIGWKSLAEPSISPDGRYLLYLLDPGADGTYFDDGYGSELRVRNLGTGKSRQLAQHSYGGTWSPGGNQILYSDVDPLAGDDFCWSFDESCQSFGRLRLVRLDGTHARDLTGKPADERSADWSAPGRIVFQSARGPKRGIAETTEVWSIRPTGECLTRLTNGAPASLSPVLVSPEGKSTGPASCMGKPPGPNRELTAPPGLAGSPVNHLWLGRSFRNVLLSDVDVDRGNSYFSYGDCGAIPASGCGREVLIYNEDVCHYRGYSAAFVGSGVIQKQRGIPVFRSLKPGRETPPFTVGFSGRNMFFLVGGSGTGDRKRQNRAEIDALRPVGSDTAAGDLPAPQFPASDLRMMKRVKRIYERTGSVTRTADRLGRGGYFVRSNLRFARAAAAAGGYRSVKCPRGGAGD